VYALGAILYACLTGRPPFQGDTPLKTLLAVARTEPPRPTQLNPKVPRDLETICLKCLHKEAARRYASAYSLAEDLRRWQAHEPIKARPVGRLERAVRWCRRKPMAAAALALLALLLVGGAVAATVIAARETANAEALAQEKNRTQQALEGSQANEQKATEAEKRALRQAAEATLERALQTCQRGEVAAGLLWLAHALRLARNAGAADLEDACRWNLGAWSREVHTLEQVLEHPRAVHGVTWGPDGKTVVTSCQDGKVRFWDAETGRPKGAPLEHPKGVLSAAYQPRGDRLATCCSDGQIRVWGPGRQEPHVTFHFQDDNIEDFVRPQFAFSPDGKTILTGGMSGTLRLWDVVTGREVVPPVVTGRAGDQGVAISPDGRLWLRAGQGWQVQIYDAASRRPLGPSFLSYGVNTCAAFSPDGKLFATAHAVDASVQLWETATRAPVGPRMMHQEIAQGLSFSPDGKLLASCARDGGAAVWEVGKGALYGPRLVHPAPCNAVAFSPEGRLATACDDGRARIWRLAPRAQRLTLPQSAQVVALAFTPDSRSVTVGLHGDQNPKDVTSRQVRSWDRSTGELRGPAFDGNPDTHGWVRGGVLYSPDGAVLYVGSHNQFVRWDARTGRRLGEIVLAPDDLTGIAQSRNGKVLVAGCWGKGACALVWGAATPWNKPRLLPHPGGVFAVALSADGRRALTSSCDGELQQWNVETGEAVGPRLAMPSRNDVPHSVSFSPDDRVVLTGGTGLFVRQWSATTWKEVGPALPHQGRVMHAVFSPDGRLILTCSHDGAGRVWHPSTGKLIGPPLAHNAGRLEAFAVAPDGKALATGAYQGREVRVWSLPAAVAFEPDDAVAWVERLTGQSLDERGVARQLSEAEWADRRARRPEPPPDLLPPLPPRAAPQRPPG
jgi:WD40 repeat protein